MGIYACSGLRTVHGRLFACLELVCLLSNSTFVHANIPRVATLRRLIRRSWIPGAGSSSYRSSVRVHSSFFEAMKSHTTSVLVQLAYYVCVVDLLVVCLVCVIVPLTRESNHVVPQVEVTLEIGHWHEYCIAGLNSISTSFPVA